MSNVTTDKKNPSIKSSADGVKWVDFDTDRELVSFERCEMAGLKPTIEGWVIGEERVKEADEEKEMPAFDCLVMILTAPAQLVDKSGTKYEVPKGTTTLVPKSIRLTAVADLGRHPTDVYQVKITPTEIVKLEGIKKMRKYKCQLNPIPAERKLIAPATMALFNQLGNQAPAPAALPAAQS